MARKFVSRVAKYETSTNLFENLHYDSWSLIKYENKCRGIKNGKDMQSQIKSSHLNITLLAFHKNIFKISPTGQHVALNNMLFFASEM